MLELPINKQQSVHITNPVAFRSISNCLYQGINAALQKGYQSIVFVCIGTDRSTGDSLGPLIGYKMDALEYKDVYIYGNLENPVHAKNLDEVMMKIATKHSAPYIIAVDACLSRMDHVGYINIGEGSIRPGAGVNKNLTPVGDMYITGNVNFGGFMDFLVLQNTRLSLVMKMADIISTSIKYAVWKTNQIKETQTPINNAKN